MTAPPYANGQIHLGHVVNKVLKDIIIKYKTLDGYDAPYVPGWDCHGSAIEQKVEQKLVKSDKRSMQQSFVKRAESMPKVRCNYKWQILNAWVCLAIGTILI